MIFRLIRGIYLLAPTLPRVWRGLVSSEIPFRIKLIPFLGVFYLFSPVSKLFSGIIDDIFVFYLLLSLFISKTRKYFEEKDISDDSNSDKKDSQTIEGEYRIKKDKD